MRLSIDGVNVGGDETNVMIAFMTTLNKATFLPPQVPRIPTALSKNRMGSARLGCSCVHVWGALTF